MLSLYVLSKLGVPRCPFQQTRRTTRSWNHLVGARSGLGSVGVPTTATTSCTGRLMPLTARSLIVTSPARGWRGLISRWVVYWTYYSVSSCVHNGLLCWWAHNNLQTMVVRCGYVHFKNGNCFFYWNVVVLLSVLYHNFRQKMVLMKLALCTWCLPGIYPTPAASPGASWTSQTPWTSAQTPQTPADGGRKFRGARGRCRLRAVWLRRRRHQH